MAEKVETAHPDLTIRDSAGKSPYLDQTAPLPTRTLEELTGKNMFSFRFLGASLGGNTRFVFPVGLGQRKDGENLCPVLGP